MKKVKVKAKLIRSKSPYFKCPKCGYAEARLILGDVSHTPCTNCGHPVMYRC